MKKLLLLMPLIATLFLTSCEGDPGPMGPMGPSGNDGEDGVVNYVKSKFTVESNDWELVDNQYYKFTFDYEELTTTMCDIGVVCAYMFWTDDENVMYQGQLPCTRYYTEEKKNDDGTTSDIFYSTTIDYEYGPNQITFFVTNSDFYIGDKPQTYNFRVITHY